MGKWAKNIPAVSRRDRVLGVAVDDGVSEGFEGFLDH